MKIKQSVINTFNRIGFDNYQEYLDSKVTLTAMNRFTGDKCQVIPLIYYLINWVYETNNKYECGDYKIKLADFDRIRYFILENDSNAYSTCID